jgi:hypothetical protein
MRWLAFLMMVALGGGHAAAQDRERPVVVELFTSQGCHSCPPADEFLAELAGRPGVLALGLHVDYWDYIGWKDPFAQRAHTERQRSYSRALHQRYVYTPQMVINGTHQNVGSDRAAIDKLIDKARKEAGTGATLAVSGTGLQRRLRIGGGSVAQPATIWLVGFDQKHETKVKAGENSGRRLANHNVVRQMIEVGIWAGAATDVALDLTQIAGDCDSAAVLVQVDGTGPIVAALRLELPRR